MNVRYISIFLIFLSCIISAPCIFAEDAGVADACNVTLENDDCAEPATDLFDNVTLENDDNCAKSDTGIFDDVCATEINDSYKSYVSEENIILNMNVLGFSDLFDIPENVACSKICSYKLTHEGDYFNHEIVKMKFYDLDFVYINFRVVDEFGNGVADCPLWVGHLYTDGLVTKTDTSKYHYKLCYTDNNGYFTYKMYVPKDKRLWHCIYIKDHHDDPDMSTWGCWRC